MASTYVNDLRLNELATGDGSGTWGNTTNTNLELIGEAFGFGTEAITTNADTHASTVADGASDQARAMFIKYTGTLDSTCTITIGPNTLNRVHIIENATSGSQSIIISQGSGANVTILTGQTKAVYLNGAGGGAAVTDAFVDMNFGGTTTIGDNLTLNTDSSVISFGADADTTLTHTDGTGLTLNSTNKLTFGDAASFVHQSSDGVLTVDGEATIDLNASTAVLVSNDLKLNSDDAVLGFGADNDTLLTHTDGTGLTLNSTNKLTFGDAASFVHQSGDGVLTIAGEATIALTASTAVTISNDVSVVGRAVSPTAPVENDGNIDLAVANNFKVTTGGAFDLTFTNAAIGQSGNILFINSGNHAIGAHADVLVAPATLTAISATGSFLVTYYCTATSGNNTILVTSSAILT